MESDDPPHLLLGNLKLVGERLSALKNESEAWDSVSRSTDFT